MPSTSTGDSHPRAARHVARTPGEELSLRQLGCGRTLDRFGQITTRLTAIVDRFMSILDCGDAARIITALLTVRDKVIAPLISGIRTPRRGRPPTHWSQIDPDYETIRLDMQTLFNDLGISRKPAPHGQHLVDRVPASR